MHTARDRITNKLYDWAALGRYRASQLIHLGRTPKLSELGKRIVHEVGTDGVSVVSLEQLGLRSNRRLLAAIAGASDALDRQARRDAREHEYSSGFEHCTPINPSTIARQFPGLYTWGLDAGLLDIVENILGLPAAYHGVCARREIVDGKDTGTRLWHRDTEDLNVTRVLIYMSDVPDDEHGPFEYVPLSDSPTYHDFRGVDAITDEEMRRVVPEDRWRRCLGPAGTVIFGAVAKIFHHGKSPHHPRKVCSYYYTSRHPKNEELCREYSFQSGMSELDVALSQRQRRCLWEYEQLLPDDARKR